MFTLPDWLKLGRETGIPPSKVTVEMPPVKPPAELSCFVKGLIRSMRETPEQWKRQDEWSLFSVAWENGPISVYQLTRNPFSTIPDEPLVDISDQNLTRRERVALTEAWLTLETPHRVKMREMLDSVNRDIAAKAAAARAPFEKLGCPDTP